MSRKEIGSNLVIAAGFLILMVIAIYFSYPWLHPDRHEEVITTFRPPVTDSGDYSEFVGLASTRPHEEIDELRRREEELLLRIDSLEVANAQLAGRLQDEGEPEQSEPVQDVRIAGDLDEEADGAFAERVKSLLNLDEEELGPIVNRMTNAQLARLYRSGGNLQREKLLRSLDSERAAQLITQMMEL